MTTSTNMLSRNKKTTLTASIRARQHEGLFPVISEVKVRSDKEGDLLRGRDPVSLACEMGQSPVAGISVVTEPDHFGGRLEPLLRADRRGGRFARAA